jgi:(E)-4-hydroxy-3-methyl-but-2-enyl pyrophosphate reductase
MSTSDLSRRVKGVKVKLAKTAGFCMGVRRAMEITLSEANKGDGKLFTYGPLIHNRQVLELLESKGVHVKEVIDEHDKGRIVVRAHGITPTERETIRSSKLVIIDATCPRVAKVQGIIKHYSNKGYVPLIFGDARHPEVVGLMGYSGGCGIVVSSVEDVKTLSEGNRFIVVSQTTQNAEVYSEVSSAIKTRFPEAMIFDTICDETYKRQGETHSLAREVDSMVIVGGYDSGNTIRLYQVARSTGKPAFHVETEQELKEQWFSSEEVVGVTAGASTPNWMIKKVIDQLKTMGKTRQKSFVSFLRKGARFLVKINVPEAVGAFSLTYAGLILSKGSAELIYPVLALLYVYGMHVLNRFLDKEASTYNDPGVALFYAQHRRFLIATALAGLGAGIILSLYLGLVAFFVFLALTLLGLIYSLPIIPWRFRYLGRYARIKDLPGSKTMAEALAWGTISSLLPIIGRTSPEWPGVLVSFLLVFSMCYVRCGLLDILNIQGDLIVGRETLPIALGEDKAVRLLIVLNLLFGTILLLAAALRAVATLGFLLLICFLNSFLYLTAYQKDWMRGGPRLQAVTEGNLLLAGLLALAWKVV